MSQLLDPYASAVRANGSELCSQTAVLTPYSLPSTASRLFSLPIPLTERLAGYIRGSPNRSVRAQRVKMPDQHLSWAGSGSRGGMHEWVKPPVLYVSVLAIAIFYIKRYKTGTFRDFLPLRHKAFKAHHKGGYHQTS